MTFMRTVLIIIAIMACTAPAYGDGLNMFVVVSLDALHPDALSEKTSPEIFRLMKEGRYTLKGTSVDPPKTLISHAAMFTGLPPQLNGKTDNEWKPGDARVGKETLFDDAKKAGFHTAFFYSKTKLGYLKSNAVDEHALAPDDGISRARTFLGKDGKRFVFLHLSGLEYEGSEYGWLSREYLAELFSLDRDLGPLFEAVRKRGKYVIIVTSDHAGHGKLHGTDHPEDYRLPLVVVSDIVVCHEIQDGPFRVTELKTIVEKTITSGFCDGRVK